MAYADPLRLRVIKALQATIQSVSIAAGYKHDLAGKVFRGRRTFDQNDPLPMVCILEKMDQPLATANPPRGGTVQVNDWEISIQGFTKEDPLNPSDPAYRLSADVLKALVRERAKGNLILAGDPALGLLGPSGSSLVMELNVGPPVVVPDPDRSNACFFYAPVTLKISEDLEDPFS